jgi:hypothetical protein
VDWFKRPQFLIYKIVILDISIIIIKNYKTIKFRKLYSDLRPETSSTREPNRQAFCPSPPFLPEGRSRTQLQKVAVL